MLNEAIRNQKIKIVVDKGDDRAKSIIAWLSRIEKSGCTITEFFDKYNVPFSCSQYYLYKSRLKEFGESGLRDKRSEGSNRKLTGEGEAFVAGCVESNADISLQWIQEALSKRFGVTLSPSGVTRLLQRLNPDRQNRTRGRRREHEHKVEPQHNSCGGFELIIALAYHLGWPQMTADAIKKSVKSLKRTKVFRNAEGSFDKERRDKFGRFTAEYNQREDVRKSRFESITEKRRQKNWKSMNVIRDNIRTIERKSLAILSLPVITMNGGIRTVDSALGQEVKHFAGFNYKQSSLTKYLNELKYLGVSENLLQNVVTFWAKCWGSEMKELSHRAFLCYYIDGNTKSCLEFKACETE